MSVDPIRELQRHQLANESTKCSTWKGKEGQRDCNNIRRIKKIISCVKINAACPQCVCVCACVHVPISLTNYKYGKEHSTRDRQSNSNGSKYILHRIIIEARYNYKRLHDRVIGDYTIEL